MIADAEAILRVCGIDSYLHIGCGQSNLVFELLKRSIDAYAVDESWDVVSNNLQRAPGRFFHGSLASFPLQDMQFGTVIIGDELFSFEDNYLPTVFECLQAITKNNLVLYFTPEAILKNAGRHELMSRLYWEKLGINSEFRRHPREMLVTPYHEFENERLGRFVFFQKIPDQARKDFSLAWLLKNRDLHMDMLREAGRRSDAHVSRYVLAASKIRPGDIVVDAACGLGYGTAVLAACSPGACFIGVDIDAESVNYANANYAADNPALSYQACDVTKLSFLEDHSVDMVVSFETIEHVPDYDIFLAEVNRVLKRDGRFIGSVPNLWCDETGNDPNPYHFHVFDWEKLNDAISKYFIVDERWAQIGGGGYKVAHGKRSMYSVPFDKPEPAENEWWIVSACANPLEEAKSNYSHSFYNHKRDSIPTLVHFDKYYDNPWLYRIMIQLGDRINDRHKLSELCKFIAVNAKQGSADQGAALCVLGYQILESGLVTENDVMSIINFINQYDSTHDKSNPHSVRWNISLHYIAGRLLMAIGKHKDALPTFISCAEMNPLLFSPLLATKTVSARMQASLLYLGENDLENAKEQLRLGIKQAHEALQGNWQNILGDLDNPLPFGLQEMAELLDIASQCSQLLHTLQQQGRAPGYIWDKINLKRFGLVEWNKSLERENSQLRSQLRYQ